MGYKIDWIFPTLRQTSSLWNLASSITFAAVGIVSKIIVEGSTPNLNQSFPTFTPYEDVQEQDLKNEQTKIQLNLNDSTT
uniref:Uncharacterized protein n=1 Tax=Timema cristinae TaxID=61476 RepID=A0A7R9H4N4_TIMCR|nr:unnamed protein product [Timema cristinae]